MFAFSNDHFLIEIFTFTSILCIIDIHLGAVYSGQSQTFTLKIHDPEKNQPIFKSLKQAIYPQKSLPLPLLTEVISTLLHLYTVVVVSFIISVNITRDEGRCSIRNFEHTAHSSDMRRGFCDLY